MDHSTTRFDKHSRKILLGFWAVLIIGGLALLEWSLSPKNGRYMAFGSDSGPGPHRWLVLREWKPNTDYHFSPTPERKQYPQGGLRDVYDLSIDAQGFIEPSIRHEKPDLNIVFVGGSTTACLYVAPQNRFPFLASQKLESTLGLKINGINAARSGNNSLHSLLILLGKVLPLKPDYVVLMEATNDIGVLSHGTYWDERGSKKVIEVQKISAEAALQTLTSTLIPNAAGLVSRAWLPVQALFRPKAALPAAIAQHTRPTASGPAPLELPAAVAPHTRPTASGRAPADMGRDFTSTLRSFVQVARAWGIKPVLMTQVEVRPQSAMQQQNSFLNREQVNGTNVNAEGFDNDHEHFNAIIRDVARSEKVMLIDLAQADNWKFGDVYDSIHFTDQGSKKAADIIAAAFSAELSASTSQKPSDQRR